MVIPKLALLGATGSIGSSTFSVLEETPELASISLATAHTDFNKLIALSHRFKIPVLCLTGINDPGTRDKIRCSVAGQTTVFFGEDELIRLMEAEDYDVALNAITGSAGLRSSLAVLQRGKKLALANKESLVMAGHLLSPLTVKNPILPVDSEHSAIFQAIGSHPNHEIRSLHITASGGAFRDLPLEDFRTITVEQALKHPNWDMGTKVTLDSATMFNKALEVIEAHWLFGLDYDRVRAVIHPQSVIHSLVEFIDGSFLAQLSDPDMRLPIHYALSYPQRVRSEQVKTSLTELSPLTFREIEPQRYPLFYLGLEVARAGGLLPTVMNAANEAALKLFMERKIGFCDIATVVERAVQAAENVTDPDLETILRVNRETFYRLTD
ncbi:MAG TPA: 1-deoxy-D-xylulose-5-phosphate reductoisomerase [Candidatus Cloacimonadota bacterium]|nr:1-deoxy-D-xylulose-5-phosphate reductoisomerase [Candidatus Cloacimonadota bacterium]